MCEVGSPERQIVLVDGEPVGIVLRLDDVGLSVVVLANGGELVEPLCPVFRLDTQSGTVDTVEAGKRRRVVPQTAFGVDVDESIPVS